MIWNQEFANDANFQKKHLRLHQPQQKQKIKAPVFIPYEILKATRKRYKLNDFIQNLLYHVPFPFDAKEIEEVISFYQLGTVCKGYRNGAITFPFIDIKGNITAIQAKQFDKTNHTKSTDFLHSIYKKNCKKNNKPLPNWLNSYFI